VSKFNLGKIVDFIKQIIPLLPLLEKLVPGLSVKIDEIQEGIEREGAEFINRNLHVFEAIAEVGEILSNAGSALHLLGITAPQYAADNELDLSEIESLTRMIDMGISRTASAQKIGKLAAVLNDIR
jgi:hypothetical protein